MNINELKTSKYLKKEDVTPDRLVTITKLEQKNMAMEGDEPDLKWCLHFGELEKPMVLNSTNAQLIAQILGTEETDEWRNKRVVLFNDPSVSFQGKLTGGIRVRAVKTKQAPAAKPAPVEDVEEDDVPF